MSNYWILLQSVYGKELQAESDLVSNGYQVYLPRKRIDLRTKRNRKIIIEALYPSYLFLFVCEGETDLHPVKKIARIVHFGNDIARASDSLITLMKSSEDEQGVHQTKYEYARGDMVRVKSGPFMEYQAIIQSLGKHDRAVIELLQGNIKAEVSLIDLIPAA